MFGNSRQREQLYGRITERYARIYRRRTQPASAPSTRPWYLASGGRLSREPGGGSSSFRYEPADPTPSVGGQLRSPQAGLQDNSAIEARADVLVFTGEPLRAPLDVLGPVRAELHVRASSGHAHVFVRLCDVDTEGRSRNVTDGIVRLGPGATGRQAVSVPQLKRARQPETQRVRHLPSLITGIPADTPPGAN